MFDIFIYFRFKFLYYCYDWKLWIKLLINSWKYRFQRLSRSWCSEPVPLYMYLKTCIARATHQTYFDPDPLLCYYINIIYFISFAMYYVESVLLSFDMVWQNSKFSNKIHRFFMGFKLLAEHLPIFWLIRLHSYGILFVCRTIIIPT